MARSDSQQIADAKAENYWSAVERRNAKRRAERAELKARPICIQCKARPVMKGMPAWGQCSPCDAEVRRAFTPEQYAEYFGQES